MVIIALFSLFFGWILGQFFKVLVLVPSVWLTILLVIVLSISCGDGTIEIALKIIAVNLLMPLGYALGQILLYRPRMLRRTTKSAVGPGLRTRAGELDEVGHAVERVSSVSG